jgi:hypothetical protein
VYRCAKGSAFPIRVVPGVILPSMKKKWEYAGLEYDVKTESVGLFTRGQSSNGMSVERDESYLEAKEAGLFTLLDWIGSEGWEMVGYACDPGDGTGHLFFKRLVSSSREPPREPRR